MDGVTSKGTWGLRFWGWGRGGGGSWGVCGGGGSDRVAKWIGFGVGLYKSWDHAAQLAFLLLFRYTGFVLSNFIVKKDYCVFKEIHVIFSQLFTLE